MKLADYRLIPKSGGWSAHPDAYPPDYRLLNFCMRVECGSTPVGGNNIQIVMGTPDKPRYGLDRDVDLWLQSGWWLTFRNQFAAAPGVAKEIVASVVDSISVLSEQAQEARGAETEALTERLFGTVFEAKGARYWT